MERTGKDREKLAFATVPLTVFTRTHARTHACTHARTQTHPPPPPPPHTHTHTQLVILKKTLIFDWALHNYLN